MVSGNLTDCYYENSAHSTEGNTDGNDSEFYPSSEKDIKCNQLKLEGLEVELKRLFVCQSTQLTDMVERMNASLKCSTPECRGE